MKDLNALQTISVFGIIFGVIVQFGLFIVNKHIETYWAVYPTWIGVFIAGTLLKIFYKGEDHHHH